MSASYLPWEALPADVNKYCVLNLFYIRYQTVSHPYLVCLVEARRQQTVDLQDAKQSVWRLSFQRVAAYQSTPLHQRYRDGTIIGPEIRPRVDVLGPAMWEVIDSDLLQMCRPIYISPKIKVPIKPSHHWVIVNFETVFEIIAQSYQVEELEEDFQIIRQRILDLGI